MVTANTDTVAKATPDGYTVGTLLTPTIVNPFVLKNLPYDTLKDLTPVSLMVMVPGAVAIVLDIAGPASGVIETDDVRRLAAGLQVVRLEDGGYAWVEPGH